MYAEAGRRRGGYVLSRLQYFDMDAGFAFDPDLTWLLFCFSRRGAGYLVCVWRDWCEVSVSVCAFVGICVVGGRESVSVAEWSRRGGYSVYFWRWCWCYFLCMCLDLLLSGLSWWWPVMEMRCWDFPMLRGVGFGFASGMGLWYLCDLRSIGMSLVENEAGVENWNVLLKYSGLGSVSETWGLVLDMPNRTTGTSSL